MAVAGCAGRHKKWLGCTDAYSNTVTVATTRPWPTALVRLGTGFNGKKLAEPVSAPPTNPTRSRARPARGVSRPVSHNRRNGRPRPTALGLRLLNPRFTKLGIPGRSAVGDRRCAGTPGRRDCRRAQSRGSYRASCSWPRQAIVTNNIRDNIEWRRQLVRQLDSTRGDPGTGTFSSAVTRGR